MTAQLYWYPTPESLLRVVDLGLGWRELVEGDPADSVSARSADGQRVLTTFTSMRTLRTLVEYLTSVSVVRECQAIGNHLRRNGVIGLAEEDGATWGGFAKSAPARGDTIVRIEENLWDAWSTADLDVGDVVVVQGASPRGVWEEAVVSAISANKRKVTLSAGLLFDYSEEPYVLIRDRRFWPFVRLQDGALNTPILRTDHRITWALELQLEEPPSRLARAATQGLRYRGTTATDGELAYDSDLDVDLELATATTTVSW